MKWEEKKAHEYLKAIGSKEIKYEPDGNIPPDFVLDSKTAIEVRRLNKHIESHETGEFEENFELQNYVIKPSFEVPPGDFIKLVFDSKEGIPNDK